MFSFLVSNTVVWPYGGLFFIIFYMYTKLIVIKVDYVKMDESYIF